MRANFLKSIDNKVSAILWITENELTLESKYFDEIDYLSNGLLSKSRHFEGLYQTENFGKNLLIGLIKKKPQEKVTDSASIHISNIKGDEDNSSKIILLHDLEESALVSKFEKKYTKFNFTEVKIETEA
jgi:hypothetical protein